MLDGDRNGRTADEVDDPVAAECRRGGHRLPIESERPDLDGEVPDTVTVWGVPVPILPSGRRAWPDTVRERAVAKALAGVQVREIVREIRTSKSVVARWVQDACTAAQVVDFVEVLPPDPHKAPAQNAGKRTGVVTPATPPIDRTVDPECRIRIGDAEITISASYPGAHLIEVLRAVREAQ